MENAKQDHLKILEEIKMSLEPHKFYPIKLTVTLNDQMYEIINRAFYQQALKYQKSCEEEETEVPAEAEEAKNAPADKKPIQSHAAESGSK